MSWSPGEVTGDGDAAKATFWHLFTVTVRGKDSSVDVRTALASRLVGRNDSQSDDVKSESHLPLYSV